MRVDGPARCARCGWSCGGDLRVRDQYAEEAPPGPRGRGSWLQVLGDEGGGVSECPCCGECFDPDSGDGLIARRDGDPLPLPWLWGFDEGPLAPRRLPTTQVEGLPPESLLVYPSPLVGAHMGGWMPLVDTPAARRGLLGDLALDAEVVLVYRRASVSQLTWEQAASSQFVARGALYELAGTLADERAAS